MTKLEGTIAFWESRLEDKYLMNPSTIVLVEYTIECLNELKKIQDSATPLAIP